MPFWSCEREALIEVDLIRGSYNSLEKQLPGTTERTCRGTGNEGRY